MYYDICMAEANGNEKVVKIESKVNCKPSKINIDLPINALLKCLNTPLPCSSRYLSYHRLSG